LIPDSRFHCYWNIVRFRYYQFCMIDLRICVLCACKTWEYVALWFQFQFQALVHYSSQYMSDQYMISRFPVPSTGTWFPSLLGKQNMYCCVDTCCWHGTRYILLSRYLGQTFTMICNLYGTWECGNYIICNLNYVCFSMIGYVSYLILFRFSSLHNVIGFCWKYDSTDTTH
jgi:hypothetical protein